MRGSDPRRVLYFFLVGIAVSGISRAAIADSFQDSENSTLTQADTESSGEPVSKPDDTPKPVESLGKIAVGWFGTLPRVHAHTAHPDLKQLVCSDSISALHSPKSVSHGALRFKFTEKTDCCWS